MKKMEFIAICIVLGLCSVLTATPAKGTPNPSRHEGMVRSISQDSQRPLTPLQLVSVVGDSSDGGSTGLTGYCLDAYNRCISRCSQTFVLGSFFGQFGLSFSSLMTGGCYMGCAIGLAGCS